MTENISLKYQYAVQFLYDEDCKTAILESEAMRNIRAFPLFTDERHGWRKNYRQTDVPCIGHSTHKVLCNQITTNQDDPVSKRHERIGTDRIYE